MSQVPNTMVNLQSSQIAEIEKLVNLVGFLNGVAQYDYAAQVNANVSADNSPANVVVDIGLLTGNITIGAPASPKYGQRLLYIFKQDVTGGRTITWNAAFKAGANGAGAGSQKGATEFFYDGTHWVQIGGPLAFA